MTRSVTLIPAIILALLLTSSAAPLVTIDKPSQGINLPFAVQLNVANVTIPEIDRARASHLFARGQAKVAGNDTIPSFDRRASSFSITNTVLAYTTVINIGSPATSHTLPIDTGSSNAWVGGTVLGPHKKGQRRASAQDTVFRQVMGLGHSVALSVSIYINWQTVLINNPFSFLGTVSLSSSLAITNQSIGAASSSQGFENVDGLLGLGPTGLTYGTITEQPNSKIPTISDNLCSQC